MRSPARLPALLCVLTLASSASAATKSVREQVDGIEMDLRDLQQKVLEMEQVQQSILQSIADLRQALALDSPGRRTPADLAARLDSVESDLRVVQENQNDAAQRVSVLDDKMDALYRRQAQIETAPPMPSAGGAAAIEPVDPGSVESESVADRGEAPAASSAPTEPLVDPEEIYQSARADYGRGSYDMALSGFQEFLRKFPDSELSDNAQYWVGECQESAGRLDDALRAYDEVLTRWPEGDKAPDAGYKKGLALLELNRTAEGIIQLQKVKDTWPDAPAGRLARTKLQALGLL